MNGTAARFYGGEFNGPTGNDRSESHRIVRAMQAGIPLWRSDQSGIYWLGRDSDPWDRYLVLQEVVRRLIKQGAISSDLKVQS